MLITPILCFHTHLESILRFECYRMLICEAEAMFEPPAPSFDHANCSTFVFIHILRVSLVLNVFECCLAKQRRWASRPAPSFDHANYSILCFHTHRESILRFEISSQGRCANLLHPHCLRGPAEAPKAHPLNSQHAAGRSRGGPAPGETGLPHRAGVAPSSLGQSPGTLSTKILEDFPAGRNNRT
jgi:hypothetical protein